LILELVTTYLQFQLAQGPIQEIPGKRWSLVTALQGIVNRWMLNIYQLYLVIVWPGSQTGGGSEEVMVGGI